MTTFSSGDNNVPAIDGEHSGSGTAIVGNSVRGLGFMELMTPHKEARQSQIWALVFGENRPTGMECLAVPTTLLL